MSLYRLFDPLRFNSDIPLRDGGGAVLQEPLNQGNVIAVILVNLCGVPLAEAVGSDALISQVIADNGKLLLDGSLCDREDKIFVPDAIPQTIVLDVLLDYEGDGENTDLIGLSFTDFKPVTVPVMDNIAGTELYNVTDTKPKVPFQYQGGCCSVIGTEAAAPFPHGLDDFHILLCGQGFCGLVHGVLQ